MSNYENKLNINNKFDIEDDDESYIEVFNRYNVLCIYLPLIVYLVLMSCKIGVLKGFFVYFCTAPIIIMMLFINISSEEEITFINILKTLLINIAGFFLCIGIISLIL